MAALMPLLNGLDANQDIKRYVLQRTSLQLDEDLSTRWAGHLIAESSTPTCD